MRGEPRVNVVSPPPILIQHLEDGVLRTLDGGERRLLRNRSDVRRRLALDDVERGSQFLRSNAPAATPPGHRIRLRGRACEHGSLAMTVEQHPGQVVRGWVVYELLVTQIDDD